MRICELALQTFAENDRLALPYWYAACAARSVYNFISMT